MNKAYVNYKGYNIKKKYLTDKQINLIEKELTVAPKTMNYSKTTFKMYEYSKRKYTLPRYWGEKNIGQPSKYIFKHEISNMKFKENVILYEFQKYVIQKSLPKIEKNGGGLISVACGGGKTIMSLYIACQLGLKTLVIVHDTELESQWKERIEYCTDAKVGIIRQKKIDIEGKDIVIGSIQSIAKKDYGDIFNLFGFVIYDEAHHVSSKWFSRSLLKTCAKYTLALTATPSRKDGLIRVMHWFLGDCVYKQSVSKNPLVSVKRIIYNTNDPKRFIPKERWIRTSENGGKLMADPHAMTISLCSIPERTQFMVNILIEIIIANPNRKILVLSWLIEHLEVMKELLDEKLNELITQGKLQHNKITTCFFYGKIKKEERKFAREYGDIIFGTFSMAKEGLDISRLNTVLFCTTQTDVRQAAGRITRGIPKEGNIRPMIIDFTDDLDVMMNHSKKRKSFYKESLYQEEDIYVFKNKCYSYQKYMKKKNIDIKIKKNINTRKNLQTIFTTSVISNEEVQRYIKLQEKSTKEDSSQFSEDSKDSVDSVNYNVNVFLKNKK
jgi:superfamily II DNA or RNA helicase